VRSFTREGEFHVRSAHRLVALLSASLMLGPAAAQTAGFHPKADVSTRLLVGNTDEAGTDAWLGLDVRLGTGWHTYWRSPGDAGAPPEFDWSGSRNVADVTVEWPAPHRFAEADIDTYGYAERVLFPLHLRLKHAAAQAHLSLKTVLYVCSVICTQNEAQLEAEIAPGAHQTTAQAEIDAWRQKVPRETSPTLSIRSLRLERAPKPHLAIEAHAEPQLAAPDVFVDGDPAVAAGRPQVEHRADADALISIPVDGLDHDDPQRPLHVTLVDGERALEAVLPREAAAWAPVADSVAATRSIWAILGTALLGGFILNLMPCVFPVLSLKVVSLIDHRPTGAPPLRAGLLATAAGILTSFAALAATLATLKAAGAQIGWGLQFQQPAFLVIMSIVLVAFAANLLGLFEINLPWRVTNRIGQAGHGRSLAGHAFNGFVMTLLATPCSAPFVGTAVAFALSQQAPQILLVFAGLGLGMASPYLALAAVPRLAGLLPRPGRWMLAVRALAAAAMIATTLWLLIILGEISGIVTAGITGALLLALLLAFAASRLRLMHAVTAAVAAVMLALALVAVTRPQAIAEKGLQEIAWQPLVPADITARVRAGHTVFVDIGASWCVTCKVNETLVVDSAAVHQRLTSDVIPVKADWTKPNGSIAAYLKSFDRYGLPFNAVFGPGAPNGIVLPELLTQQVVLDAIDTASRSATAQ